jgi:hypothetical protein
MMTARARDLFVGLALMPKQFKLPVALRTAILIKGHFYSLPFSKALKNASGTGGTWVSTHVFRQLKEQKL